MPCTKRYFVFMCGRFTISKTEEELEKRFGADFYTRVLEARYNIAPSRNSPVITGIEPNTFQFFRWGLIPFWAKEAAIGLKMINARLETVREKPAFREAWLKRRCLVVADSWYEWKADAKRKQPFRLLRKDRDAFAFAGLWESWHPPSVDQNGGDKTRDPDQTLHSFTILTRPAHPVFQSIHDRMPVILQKSDERLWIDPLLPESDFGSLLDHFEEDDWESYPVSDAVNNARNEDKRLLEPVELPGKQGGLFDA